MLNARAVERLLSEITTFSHTLYPAQALRGYQQRAASLLLAAIEREAGETVVVLMARQAGKDETLAQVLAFLLAQRRLRGGAVVFATPTLRPQGLISQRRLAARLMTPLHRSVATRDGSRVLCGAAAVHFLSAHPAANARGETAGLALVANEAQDIDPGRWDAVFAPMTASTNAPGLYAGTPWQPGSLLSQQTLLAEERGTLIRVPWPEVAAEVPAYGAHVRERIAQIGESHPFFQSEYCLVEPDGAGRLFPPARLALLRGDHPRQYEATPGREYALLLDVGGGEDTETAPLVPGPSADGQGEENRLPSPSGRGAGCEGSRRAPPQLADPRRQHDSTALTVVEIDRSRLGADLLTLRPHYRVVSRAVWTGDAHARLLPELAALAREVWRARWLVGDATGIGAGLVSFLATALAGHCTVLPFVFSQASKSALGWDFLGAVLTGRYAEYLDDGAPDTRAFWRQAHECRYTVAPGPGRLMRWGVPPALGHDDLLISAALVAVLDRQDWRPRVARGRSRD